LILITKNAFRYCLAPSKLSFGQIYVTISCFKYFRIIVFSKPDILMTGKNTLFTAILALAFSFLAYGQDPHFSQFYANPLYLNPAFAGADKCPRFNMNFRNQYPLANAGIYRTFSASYDQYVEGMKGGLGFIAMRDDAGNGTLSLTEVSGIYSYHLEVTRKFSVMTGFQATFRQRQLDWGNFTFPDMIDDFYGFVKSTSEVAPGNTTNQHLDLSVGMLGFTERWYLGGVLHHLTEPNEAFFSNNKLPMKFTVHGGATIPLGKKRLINSTQNMLIPHFVYQTQGGANQFTGGLSFSRSAITGGLAFRQGSFNPDALIVLVGFAPPNVPFRFGISYDYTVSALTNSLGGATEISLAYQFPCRIRKTRVQAIKCPRF
jgi:type IX secretion system PorP/SprF family membrane protein